MRELRKRLKAVAASRGITLAELLGEAGTSVSALSRMVREGQASTRMLARLAPLAGCELRLVDGKGEEVHTF